MKAIKRFSKNTLSAHQQQLPCFYWHENKEDINIFCICGQVCQCDEAERNTENHWLEVTLGIHKWRTAKHTKDN